MTDWRTRVQPGTLAALAAMQANLNVAGSTSDGELDILVEELISRKCVNVLQLGTYLGWSALVIADVIAENDGELLTVDPTPFFLETCEEYAEKAGLPNISTMQGCSESETLAAALGTEWDAIYIDTTHQYTQTVRELELYAGRAHAGTLILLHDASEFAIRLDAEGKGVKAAILEWLAAHPEWTGRICEPPEYPAATLGLGVMVKNG